MAFFMTHRFSAAAKSGLVMSTALAGLLSAAPALADSATPEGAKVIADAYAHSFGRKLLDTGILTVTPNGDHYDATFAADSTKQGLPADAAQIQLGPIAMHMTQNDDGTYAFTIGQPSIDLAFKSGDGEKHLEFAEHLMNCSGSGTIDLKAMIPLQQSMACDSVAVTMRSPVEDVDGSMGKLTFQSSAKPGESGAVDMTATGDALDLVETVTLKDPHNPSKPIAFRADRVHQDASLGGLRNTQLLEALAFFVDHDFSVAQADTVAAQVKLKAMLPLWDSLKGDIRYDNLSVGTPKGIVKVASVDVGVTATGAVKNAQISESISASGLELPDGMVPDWATAVVPKKAAIKIDLTGIDFDTTAAKLIDALGTPSGPGRADSVKTSLLLALLGSPPHLSFEQDISAPAIDVKGQGETSLMPTQKGTATITASSLDAVMDALTKAASTTPSAQRGIMGIAFLKGLAKTGPDGRLTWDIDFDSGAKKVIVNGQSFGPSVQKP